jgi:hypothetical protein
MLLKSPKRTEASAGAGKQARRLLRLFRRILPLKSKKCKQKVVILKYQTLVESNPTMDIIDDDDDDCSLPLLRLSKTETTEQGSSTGSFADSVFEEWKLLEEAPTTFLWPDGSAFPFTTAHANNESFWAVMQQSEDDEPTATHAPVEEKAAGKEDTKEPTPVSPESSTNEEKEEEAQPKEDVENNILVATNDSTNEESTEDTTRDEEFSAISPELIENVSMDEETTNEMTAADAPPKPGESCSSSDLTLADLENEIFNTPMKKEAVQQSKPIQTTSSDGLTLADLENEIFNTPMEKEAVKQSKQVQTTSSGGLTLADLENEICNSPPPAAAILPNNTTFTSFAPENKVANNNCRTPDVFLLRDANDKLIAMCQLDRRQIMCRCYEVYVTGPMLQEGEPVRRKLDGIDFYRWFRWIEQNDFFGKESIVVEVWNGRKYVTTDGGAVPGGAAALVGILAVREKMFAEA